MSRAKTHHFTEADVARCRARHDAGESWEKIATTYGCSADTLRRQTDPVYASYRREKYTGPQSLLRAGEARLSKKEEAWALARVRPDTRSRLARFMGDPPAGRSALEKKRFAAGLSPVST